MNKPVALKPNYIAYDVLATHILNGKVIILVDDVEDYVGNLVETLNAIVGDAMENYET